MHGPLHPREPCTVVQHIHRIYRSTIEIAHTGMWAPPWKFWTKPGKWDHLSLRVSRLRTCTGWAGGSISGLLQKRATSRATANSFTWASFCSWSSKGHTSTTVWKKIRSVPHFLQPPAIDLEPESNTKMYANQMARRDGANLKAHISSRAFPREIPVRGRLFRTPFSTTF